MFFFLSKLLVEALCYLFFLTEHYMYFCLHSVWDLVIATYQVTQFAARKNRALALRFA